MAKNIDANDRKAPKITKDMPIGDIVSQYPDTVEVFINNGLHCIGCAARHFENLEQGCAAHGIDVDDILKELNECVGSKEGGSKGKDQKGKGPGARKAA